MPQHATSDATSDVISDAISDATSDTTTDATSDAKADTGVVPLQLAGPEREVFEEQHFYAKACHLLPWAIPSA